MFDVTQTFITIWLGNKRNSPVKYMPHLQMEWNPPKFKTLGIWFTNDLKECEVLNFSDKFSEIRALYEVWLKRQITPLGRVAVLKSLILSKIIHLWMLLPNPPDNLVNELQKTVFQFVWNRKQDRISRKIAVRSIAKGGFGIPNIKTYINALKLIWIRKLKTSEHMWKSIIKSTYQKMSWFEQLGSSLHFQEHEVNQFWSHVFMAYKEFGKQIIHVENSEELVAAPIFRSDNILVGNRFLKIKTGLTKACVTLKNMLNDNGTFILFKKFNEKFGIKTDYITYIGCVQAIKSYIRKTEITVEAKNSADLIKTLKTTYNQRKGSCLYYEVLTQNITRPNCCDK